MKKEELLKNIKSSVDPDMSKEAKEFYYQYFPKYMDSFYQIQNGYRGDSLISLGWSFGVKNKTGIFDINQRSYNRLFDKDEIKLFYLFREGYHSRANFIIIPTKLNLYRGAYRKNDNDNNGYGTCDYPDIFLRIVRSFFIGDNLSEREKNYVAPYENWLIQYGVGEEGWKNFVDSNYLNPFVNKDYEVKDLFAPFSEYKETMCSELVGTYHDFDWCLPRCGYKNFGTVHPYIAKERMINFIRNSLWIWDQRADIIASS